MFIFAQKVTHFNLQSGTFQFFDYRFKVAKFMLFMFFSLNFAYSQSTANYTFSTNTNGSLALDANGNAVDMSTGTTQLVGAGLDAASSGVVNIGFNFVFMGSFYSQFSVQDDGIVQLGSTNVATNVYTITGGTSTSPRLSAFNSDFRTGTTTGRIHSKIIGNAPNRVLVIEFKDMQLFFTNPGTSGTSTWQMRFYETSGVIEYVYGAMNVSSVTAGNRSPSIGFYVGSASGSFSSVAYATNTVATSGTYTANPAIAAVGDIPNLNTTIDGSRRFYRFTPPVPASGPSSLNFTSITASGMTLNWTAASPTTGIVRYVVLRSQDGGVTYNSFSNVALGTNTLSVTGLSAGTTYNYIVVAVSEGAESISTSGVQATIAGATYYWTGATGGTFSTTTNWNTQADGLGTNPTTLASTDTYIFDGAGTTSGGNLTVNLSAAQSVGQIKITDNTNLTLQSSTTTTRTITINGGGGVDLDIPLGCTLNLNNATQAASIVFSGTGNIGNISGTYNAGGSTSNTLTTTGGSSTLVTVSSTGIVNLNSTGNSLVGSVATLLFASGSNCNSSGATTGAPPVPLATWDTNSTLTVSGLTTSTTAPTNASQSFGNLVFNCPSLTASHNWASTATIKGNLTITTGTGNFRLVSTGTATINGNVSVLAGTFAPFSSTGTVIVNGNTIINAGANLNLSAGAGTYSQRGSLFTNNGTIIGTGSTTASVLGFLSFSDIPLTFDGSGTVSSALNTISVQTLGGLTISHTNQIPVLRTNLFYGNVTGSDKLTFGTGAALACTIQMGATGITNPAGRLLSAPTWNLGTGTLSLLYNQGSTSYTTGFEIPPSRTVTNTTTNTTNGVVLNGGDLNVTGTLTMTAGLITTSSGNILGLSGTLSGTPSATNMVNGPFNRTYPASRTASGTYGNTTVLPVGKGGLYTPIFIDPTTTAGGPVTFTGEAFTTNSGTLGSGVTSLASTRYEAIPTAGGANLTSTFIRLTDANVIATSKLLQASTAAGVYESLPLVTNFATGVLTTATAIPVSSFTGYLSFGEVTPCSVPVDQATNLIFPVRSTTTLTANFSAAASNPTGYLVVRTASGTPATNPIDLTNYSIGASALGGTIAYVGSALTFNQTGLTANTTYDYTIFTFNNSGCAGPVYNVSSPLITSVTTCASVTGTPGTPTRSNSFSNSFTANWTASSTSGVDYIVDVATNSGFTTFVSGYQGLNVGSALSINITGLNASTLYYVRVRANLGGCESANSSTLTVTTECNPEIAPTSVQNFTSYIGTAPNPPCWIEATGVLAASSTLSGTTSAWTNRTNGFANISSSNMGASINLYSTKNDWIISQPIDLGSTPGTYRLKYRYAVTTFGATGSVSTLGTHKVDVVVSTDGGNTWSNANVIKTYTDAGTYSTSGAFETINLSSYSGVVKIAFVATTTSTSPDIDFHIDDFSVEALPLCDSPAGINATTSITDISAAINWLVSSSNPANGYEWEVRTSGAGGSGPSGLAASGSVGAGILTTNVSGLTQNTSYTVYVRSNCNGSDFSNWMSGGGFTTLQTPATLPYSDNFNTNNFIFVNGLQTNKWAYGTATGNTGNSIYISNDNGVSNTYDISLSSVVHAYRDIVIPNGSTIANVSFDWLANGESCCDYLKVWLVPTTFIPSAGTQTSSGAGRVQVGGTFNSQTTWQSYSNSTVNVSSFAGTTMRIIFEWYNDGSVGVQGPGAIDNVSVSVPSCIIPTALNASSPTINGATISWTASSSNPVNGYDYYVSTSNVAPNASTSPTGNVGVGTSIVLNNLNSSTQYYVWVRSNCGSLDYSAWTSSVTFTTLCDAISSLPYNMNFESTAAGSMPVCWSTSASSGSTTWAVRNGSSGDISGPYQGTQFLEKDYNTSTAIAVSQNFNFSSITNPIRLNVYLHRHASANVNDRYRIYVNNAPSLTGATEVFSLFSLTTTAPTVPSTGWYNYLVDIPSTFYGQSSVYVIIQGITTAGFSSYDLGVDNFTIEFSPDCSVTSVYNGTTWVNGGPYANQRATITGTYSGPGFTACELAVTGTGNATFTSGVLNITGAINVESTASLTLNNGVYVTQGTNADNLGTTYTVKRNSAEMVRLDYTGWSSPVTGQNLLSFTPQTLANRFYEYNGSAYASVVPSTNNFLEGRGMLLRAPNNWSSTTPTVYPGSFTGNLNNGPVSVSVNQGHALIGNPYPSPIDAEVFLLNNAGLATSIYFWTHTVAASGGSYTQNNYAIFNASGGTAADAGGAEPDGIIEVGQGFLIDVTAGGGNAIFNNGQRLTSSNGLFFRNSNITNASVNNEKHRIWLGLTSPGNKFNQALIAYVQGATNSIDPSFDGKLFGTSNSVLYSNLGNDKFGIQGRALPFVDSDVVNLGFFAQSAGQFTITLDKMDGLFLGNQNVYLKDNLTNTIHDIKAAPYSFTSEVGEFNSRFQIVYTNSVLSNPIIDFNENNIIVFQSQNGIEINAGTNEIKDVRIFDIRGRLVQSQLNVNASITTVKNVFTQEQVLLVQITSLDGITITKKVIH